LYQKIYNQKPEAHHVLTGYMLPLTVYLLDICYHWPCTYWIYVTKHTMYLLDICYHWPCTYWIYVTI